MSRPEPGWSVRTVSGPAATLHEQSTALVAPPGPAARQVRVLEATDRCVVLGSTEPASRVDAGRLAEAGMTVTRRRSGGGAVLVGPGEAVWVDVIVPAGDARWIADVGRAGWWLGDLWVRALAGCGVGPVQTWRGRLVRTEWSDRVCFAGLGPGEVTASGRKVVGISQRRTRAATLLQCALLVRWAPDDLLGVLALGDEERNRAARDLGGAAVGVGADRAPEILRAFLAGFDDGPYRA